MCLLFLSLAIDVSARIKPSSYLSAMNAEENVVLNKQVKYTFLKGKDCVKSNEFGVNIYTAVKRYDVVEDYITYDSMSSIKYVIGVLFPSYHQVESDGIFYNDLSVCEYSFDAYKNKPTSLAYQKTYDDVRYLTSIYLISESFFIGEQTVTLDIPSWLDVEVHEFNFGKNITKTVEKKSSKTIYKYTVKNQHAMKRESHAPGNSYIYPHILLQFKKAEVKKGKMVSYMGSVADLYSWYHSLMNTVDNDKRSVLTEVSKITKDCRTDLERIQAIYSWVQSNIRYIAFEDGIAGYRPDAAQNVMRKKFGDCKGMANLLKTMLVSMGYDARMAWIGTNHIAYDYSTPTLAVDNHCICALFYGGKIYYLDATCDNMALGVYPSSIQGRQTLIENGDKYLLERVPDYGAEQNTDSICSSYTLSDGVLKGNLKYIFAGESKQVISSLIDQTRLNYQDMALNLFMSEVRAGRKITNLKRSSCLPSDSVVSLSCDIENSVDLQVVNSEVYLDLDSRKPRQSSYFRLDKRNQDFQFNYKSRNVQHTEVALPRGAKVTLPEPLLIDRDGYKFSVKYNYVNGKIVYDRVCEIKNLILKVNQMKQWNDDMKALDKAYLSLPIVKL